MKITTNDMIDAAEEYASNYNDDDREHIKTDVINAFYAGIRFAMLNASPESAAPSTPSPRDPSAP